MILGIGIDLCDVERMHERLEASAENFVEAVFLPAEIAYCQKMHRPAEHFAARFAAKEAVVKALAAAGGQGTFWRDIEIVREDTGRPRVVLTGRLGELAGAQGAREVHVSITHTAKAAVAVAVAEG